MSFHGTKDEKNRLPIGAIGQSYSFKNPHNSKFEFNDNNNNNNNDTDHESRHHFLVAVKIGLMNHLEAFWFQLLIVALVVLDIIFFFFEMSSTITQDLTIEFLVIVQFVIAMVFVVELLLKLYVYSFVKFIMITTNLVDTIIIIVSAVAAILELVYFISDKSHNKSSTLAGGSMFVRLIRLLRLFRLLRIYRVYGALKMTQHNQTENNQLSLTPNAQVLDILSRVRRCLLVSGEFDEYVAPLEVEWVIEVVKTDKLGKAMVDMDQEEQKFIDEMGGKHGILLNANTEATSFNNQNNTGNSGSANIGGTGNFAALATSLRKRRNTTYHLPTPQGVQYAVHSQVHDILLTADHSWNFDVFALRDASENHPLTMVGFHFFTAFGLTAELQVSDETLLKFLTRIESGYDKSNPYHNNTHAADVTQSLCFLLKEFGLLEELTPLQVCAGVFSAIVHDYLHVGYTNKFLIATDHPLALRYNDKSVLENHSVAMALELSRSPRLSHHDLMALAKHNNSTGTNNLNHANGSLSSAASHTNTLDEDVTNIHGNSNSIHGMIHRGSGIFKWLKRRTSNNVNGSNNNNNNGNSNPNNKQGYNAITSPAHNELELHGIAVDDTNNNNTNTNTNTNDVSGPNTPQQSPHVAANKEIRLFDKLSESEFRELRAISVDMVLHTDMAKHFELIGRMEAHEHTGYNTSNNDHVTLILQVILHMADISNPAKSLALYSKWMDAVMTEFRRQGQFEKDHSLPISMFMDPEGGKEMEKQCQSAFIDLFCLPFVQAFHRFIAILKPAKKHKSQEILDQLESNRATLGGNPRTTRRRNSKNQIPPSPKRKSSFLGNKDKDKATLTPAPATTTPQKQSSHQHVSFGPPAVVAPSSAPSFLAPSASSATPASSSATNVSNSGLLQYVDVATATLVTEKQVEGEKRKGSFTVNVESIVE